MMNRNQYFAVTSYALALLIVLSWLVLCPFDALADLPSKGFKPNQIASLPTFLQPLYKGNPNFITLVCYILFAFSAFLILKEKKPVFRIVSITSFIMLVLMLFCL